MRELAEDRMTEIVKSFGLSGWYVVWAPDENQPRGQIKLESRTILVHDFKVEDALGTVLHEVLELKLRSLLSPYRRLVNMMIQWIDDEVYRIKERTIEELIPLLVRVVEDEGRTQRVLKEAKN